MADFFFKFVNYDCLIVSIGISLLFEGPNHSPLKVELV